MRLAIASLVNVFKPLNSGVAMMSKATGSVISTEP